MKNGLVRSIVAAGAVSLAILMMGTSANAAEVSAEEAITDESASKESAQMPEDSLEDGYDSGQEAKQDVDEDTPQGFGKELLQDGPKGNTEQTEMTVDLSEYIFNAGGFGASNPEIPVQECNGDGRDYTAAGDITSYIYSQLKDKAEVIDISAYDLCEGDDGIIIGTENTKWYEIYSYVVNDHPELYYVGGNCGYMKEGDRIVSLIPQYDLTASDAAFDAEVKKALSILQPGMTQVQKAIALHDYVVLNTSYSKEGNYPYSAYGVMVEHQGVCQGYAEAYAYLLECVGIPTYLVSSREMNHAWDLIVLDGEHYHVDPTWDDPVSDRLGRVRHAYMFLSDRCIRDMYHNHRSWTVYGLPNGTATSSKYDSPYWEEVDSALLYHVEMGVGYYYFLEYDSYDRCMFLKRASADFDIADLEDPVTIKENLGIWKTSSGGWWVGTFANLYEANRRLYFNTPNAICSINWDGSDMRTEFAPSLSGTQAIYGSVLRNGQILYIILDTPNNSTTTYRTANVGPISTNITTPNRVESFAMGLNGYITAKFNVQLSDYVYRIEVGRPGGGVSNYVVGTQLIGKKTDVNRYDVECAVSPKDMSKAVVIRAYGQNGDLIPFTNAENIVNGAYSISTAALAEKMRTSALSSTAQKHTELAELASRLNMYGEYAAKYFYGTNPSKSLPEYTASDMSFINSSKMTTSGTMPSGLVYSGMTLSVKDGTSVNFYFKPDTGRYIGDYSFKLDGTTLTAVVSTDNPGLYRVTLSNVAAADMDNRHTLVISKSGGTSYTINFSAISYIEKVINRSNDVNLKNLVKAMYYYHKAANAYF